MNSYDLDSLHRLTDERHAQRLCEAETERLARALRANGGRRRRLRLTLKPAFGASHRLRPRRLETHNDNAPRATAGGGALGTPRADDPATRGARTFAGWC